MLLQGLAREGLLPLGMGEELDRQDVGVAVDDPAGQHRAGLRDLEGAALDARHEVGQGRDEGDDPKQQRQDELRVDLQEQQQGADGVDRHEPECVDRLHHRFPQRGSGLHDLVGDAPGEVVLEEGKALAQHVAMRLPADQVGQAGHDGLVDQQGMQPEDQGPQDQRDESHDRKGAAMFGKEGRGRLGFAHQIDDLAEEGEKRDLDQRGAEADQHDGAQQRPDLLGIVPIEGGQPSGRLFVGRGGKVVD